MKICSVAGCDKKVHAKDWCGMHYRRFKRRGNVNTTLVSNGNTKHGMHGTPEYCSWQSMKKRCLNSGHKLYHRYGGRGITVCARWIDSFATFYNDMGDKPFPKAELDRIDNDGNYEPSNCAWVTSAMNCRHTSRTILTVEKAREIRELYSTGNYTKKQLGIEFGVYPASIRQIVNNKAWKENV